MKIISMLVLAAAFMGTLPSMAQTNDVAWPKRICVGATNEAQYGIKVAVSDLLTAIGQKRVDISVPADRNEGHIESISLLVHTANLVAPLAIQETNHMATTMFLLHDAPLRDASLAAGYGSSSSSVGMCFVIDLGTYLSPKH